LKRLTAFTAALCPTDAERVCQDSAQVMPTKHTPATSVQGTMIHEAETKIASPFA
jgi:hypothetical protein